MILDSHLDSHPESDQCQHWITSRGSPLVHTYQFGWHRST